ncbi:MAG: metallophosphoesterase family protein [Bacillota bacterium]
MKIGVISDSHGMIDNVEKALMSMGEIDLLIHLGDHCKDIKKVEALTATEIVTVRGNCDGTGESKDEVVLEAAGHKLLLAHGHQFGVKEDINRLHYRALELNCDIALFGHTHIPLNIHWEGVLLMNPGSVSLPKGSSKASCGIIRIEGDKVDTQILNI